MLLFGDPVQCSPVTALRGRNWVGFRSKSSPGSNQVGVSGFRWWGLTRVEAAMRGLLLKVATTVRAKIITELILKCAGPVISGCRNRRSAKGVRSLIFVFGTLSVAFWSIFLMLLSLFSSLFCQTPFAGLLLRQGDNFQDLFTGIHRFQTDSSTLSCKRSKA